MDIWRCCRWKASKVFKFNGKLKNHQFSHHVYKMNIETLEWTEHHQGMLHARAYHRTVVGGANLIHLGGDHSKPDEPVDQPGKIRNQFKFEKFQKMPTPFTLTLSKSGTGMAKISTLSRQTWQFPLQVKTTTRALSPMRTNISTVSILNQNSREMDHLTSSINKDTQFVACFWFIRL